MVNWLPKGLFVSVPFSKIKDKVQIEDNCVKFLNEQEMEVKFNDVMSGLFCKKFKIDKSVIGSSRCDNSNGKFKFRMHCKHGGAIYLKIGTAQFISSFNKADETLWFVEKHNKDDQCDAMLREYITKNIEAVPSSSTNIKEELGALKRSAQKLAKKASKVLEEVREEASMMEGKIKALEAKLVNQSNNLSIASDDEDDDETDEDDDETDEDDDDSLDTDDESTDRLAKALENLEKARRAYEIERVRAENERK